MLTGFASVMPALSFTWPALALGVVIGLIFLSQRAFRATGYYRRQAGQRLAVVEALALDPRRRLHLIRCENRSLLLLTGGTQDLVVGWLPEVQP
jgi:flagellar protein FliO/FliZ